MPRLKNLDCLRTLAILAVLVIHAPDSAATRSVPWQFFNQFCRFAVPYFFLVSGFFFARAYAAAEGKRAVLGRYARRLLVLFVFWTLFYAVTPPKGDDSLRALTVAQRLEYIIRHPKVSALYGSAFHLWFLSALIQAVVLVWLCLQTGRRWVALAIGGVLYGVALLASTYPGGWPGLVWFNGVAGMFFAAFYATLFVAVGAAATLYAWRPTVGASAALAATGLFVHWTEAWWLHARYGMAISNHSMLLGTVPLASGIFFLGLALPQNGPDWLARAGKYSLGVYVMHVYVARCLSLLPGSGALLVFPPLYLGIVYLVTLGASVALARLPYVRRLVT